MTITTLKERFIISSLNIDISLLFIFLKILFSNKYDDINYDKLIKTSKYAQEIVNY